MAASRAHGQGAQLSGLPSGWSGPRGRSLSAPSPSPKRTPLLPPAAAPPHRRPPARAGPEPPRQPASEGSARGWDLEEAAEEDTAAAARASCSAPTSGPRGQPRLSTRLGGPRGRPRWLRRCLGFQAPAAAAAGEQGALSPGLCVATLTWGADRRTYRLTDRQTGSAGLTDARGCRTPSSPLALQLHAAPSARRPFSALGPSLRPLGADRDRECCAAPALRRQQSNHPGPASWARSLRVAHRTATTSPCPVGALCPGAGAPRPGLHGRRKGRLVERASQVDADIHPLSPRPAP